VRNRDIKRVQQTKCSKFFFSLFSISERQQMARRNNGNFMIVLALMLGQLTSALDVGMVNVSLPTIGKELNISITAAGWIIAIFFLTITGLMISFGRLGDVVGHKKVFIVGLSLFMAGSIGSGLAANYYMLLATRTCQGLGAGMLSANFTALIMAAFPEEQRGKALGLAATAITLGLAAGPLVGGIICGTLGWRYVFFVTPLLAIAAIILCQRFVPESPVEEGETLDLFGSLLILLCLAPATLALSQGRIWGWTSAATIALIVTSLAAALFFVWHERNASHPVIELKLFSNPDFSLSNLTNCAAFICLASLIFATPFFLQYFLEMSPIEIGLVICFTNAIALLLLFPSGALSDHIGTIKLEASGLTVVCLSLVLLALAGSNLTLTLVLLCAGLFGLGYGVFGSPNYSACMGSVPESQLGVAGGVYGTMRNIGSLAGIAMAGTVMGEWALKKPDPEAAGDAFTSPAFQAAVRHAYLATSIVALLGIILVGIKFYHHRRVREVL
jgi:EmrB/QacA subfamily drug resistance transporter